MVPKNMEVAKEFSFQKRECVCYEGLCERDTRKLYCDCKDNRTKMCSSIKRKHMKRGISEVYNIEAKKENIDMGSNTVTVMSFAPYQGKLFFRVSRDSFVNFLRSDPEKKAYPAKVQNS